MYVFPVFPVKQGREDKEYRDEQQYINTNALTLGFHWLGDIGHEVDEIVDSRVELLRLERQLGATPPPAAGKG